MCPYAFSYKSDTYEPNLKVKKYIKEISDLEYDLHPRKLSTQVLNSDDIDKLLLCPREPEPNHHDSKRKLLEACRHLNDSINKLKVTVVRACGEAARGLALHRSMLQAAPRPAGATSYALSVHTMQSQRDVLNKLNSDEAMSREEFLKNMNYAVTAVNNSAECAAQAAYLISVSDQDKSIGLNGPVDVGKLHNAVHAVEDTCISIITTNDDIQIAEEKKVLKSQVKDLEGSMRDAIEKTKEGELKNMLKECTKDLLDSHQRLDNEQDLGNKDKLISRVADLMHDVSNVSSLLEHPDLVPVATNISADTQKHVDEIVKNSLTLLSNTEDLVKQVKAAPEEPETMKWVMFNKRKDVLDAFENLLRSVKFDLASKWLSKPMCKPDVKTKGQEAVRNLMEVANKVAEDLPGSDKEDMRNLLMETEQLLKDCSQKYDQEQYSVLLERVRELKKGVSRGVVSKLVQDFMQAEEPLADLDLIVDYEKDESKRKFMLEKKIAELLAQLGRTELLAPMLVKAAQERIERPDDKAVIENYKSLLAKYAESMSKIRDLCDQSVDPMEFVQTAGETIERMREESTHNDPQHNAHKSAAITKLANRVIHVGLSSSTARRDPELQRALGAAQQQLAAAAPAPGARASRLPDFNDTTARILQATEEVESLLCGETIFKQQPAQDQPIFVSIH
ncbi:hypothetical protein HF086_015301 [Spodoptera exigua]|uniref:Vinculin n=1 Tax=Spodoptera exigua TaxID=7107 RepID=A0A922SE77_SPOEX|nr:hypothetical protein HF086_015301 [Spodoptera exigua]